MPEVTSESRSSVAIKHKPSTGEVSVEVKVYEGEDANYVLTEKEASGGNPGEVVKQPLGGEELPAVAVQRLMATIFSLERQRIKVVGRELPEVETPGDTA